MNEPHMGWQCPCCRTVYAPSVMKCLQCSGAPASPNWPTILPSPQPYVVPTVWYPDTTDGTGPWLPPYEITCNSFRMEARKDGWMINGERAQVSNTDGVH